MRRSFHASARPLASRVFPALAVLLLQACSSPGTEGRWEDGDEVGPWTVRYTGYGEVSIDDSSVTLEPRSADSPDQTHGALVQTTARCQDASFAVTVRTESQVRQGPPNPWEVGWVLWNFHDDTRFYAVALKPNGWELSKQDPAYPGNQRFLDSAHTPHFPIGEDHRVAITQDWPAMTVTVDGTELVTFVDDESPYRGGSAALYTEDARVVFTDFELPDCLLP